MFSTQALFPAKIAASVLGIGQFFGKGGSLFAPIVVEVMFRPVWLLTVASTIAAFLASFIRREVETIIL